LKVQQQWQNQNTREKYLKVGGAEFVGFVLTQIKINIFQDVLAQITRDIFFPMKDRGQKNITHLAKLQPKIFKNQVNKIK